MPEVERFGEKDKATGQQNWEDAPAGSALEGLLLPTPPGKDYRLLKVVTQAATADQLARLGNDRAPVLRSPSPQSITLQDLSDNPSFQGLFQFNFEEALAKRLGKAVDMRFTEKADFSFSNSGDPLSGRFHGTVDSPDGPGGETTGTFRLHLPNGLDRRDAARLLDHASLEISIETVPERFR